MNKNEFLAKINNMQDIQKSNTQNPDEKKSPLKTLMKMFKIGMNKDQTVPMADLVRPLDHNFKPENFPASVEKYWNYWVNNCHDDSQTYKNMTQVWQDMEMLYFNCLDGNEKLLTQEYGVVPISSIVNEKVTVLTSNGWQDGDIKYFGKDFVYDVHFKRKGKRDDRIVKCTLKHRWRIQNKDFVETKDLVPAQITFKYKPSDKIDYISINRENIDENSIDYIYGVRHGLIYGDGTTVKKTERNIGYILRICSDKEDLLPYFNGYTICYPPSFNNDPVVLLNDDFSKTHPLKDFPYDFESDEYLIGFFRGWLAADGTVDKQGRVFLCCGIQESEWLIKNMPRVGINIDKCSIVPKSNKKRYIRGKEVITKKELVTVKINRTTLLKSDILIKRKKDRFIEVEPVNWSFSHIDYDSKQEVDVYCAVVPETSDFVLEDGLLTGNCPLYSRAMKLIVDEVIQADLNNQCIGVEAKEKQKDFLLKFFDDLSLYSLIKPITSDIVQYGNCGTILSVDEKGVRKLIPINIYDFKAILEFSAYDVKQKMENRDKFFMDYVSRERMSLLVNSIMDQDNYTSYFESYTLGYQVGDYVLPPWRFLHFKNKTTKTPFKPFGQPLYIHGVAPYRQFDAAMTLQVCARGARFPIDVYAISASNQVDPVSKLNFVIDFLRNIQNSGFKDIKKEEHGIGDTIVTIKELFEYSQITPQIELGKIDDIEMLRNDLIIATELPRNLIDPNDSGFGDSGVSLVQKWKPFARLVYSIQSIILEQITQLCKIHMIQSGQFALEEIDFQLTMPYPESQIDKDMIDNQKDLIDLAGSVMDTLSNRFMNGEPIPQELAKNILYQILPYDQSRMDLWFNLAKKGSEETSNVEDTKNSMYESIKLYEKKLNRPKLLEEIQGVIFDEKQKKFREGVLGGKHYFSSKNKNDVFQPEKLREWEVERMKNGKERLNEEVDEIKYVFQEEKEEN